nr:peptidoglycan-binding protein [Candidatus Paceibacterota bacterium]
ISNYRLYNTYPSEINNKIAVGVHTFTVKATSGQYSVSKQLSFEVLPQGTQKPIINDQIQPNMAVDEYAYPGSIPDNSWYLYTVAPPDTCTLVSGQLPPGITLRKSDYGSSACVLSGIARQTGVFKVVWRAQNQFGSDERELTVSVYRPSETYEVSVGGSLPDGVVGRPYYYKINFTTTGNPDITSARFLPRDSALHNVGLTLNEITGEITGTPTKAWSGMVAFNYGISTFLHLSGQKSVQLTIKDSGSAQVSPSVHSQVLGVNTMSLSCFSLPRNLIRGAESEEVSSLQNFLIQKGFLESPSTGFYGDNTVEGVKDYQASKGLPATGMVFDFTRKAIEEETCR